jgi:outer membrane putative beta-barrel porin/alpha-amylase
VLTLIPQSVLSYLPLKETATLRQTFLRVKPRPIPIAAILIVLCTATALAQSSGSHEDPAPQQNATEPDLINADRPGIADGSTVVGPKTFQIESGMQEEFRRNGDSREHTFFLPTLLRFGIDSHWEVRVEGNTYTRVTEFQSRSTTGQTSGFAPVSLGFKYHIFESNNDHQFSLGTIVRVFPAWGSKEFRTEHATGDIRLAADWNFAPRLKLSLNPNIGAARYEDDQGRLFTAGLFAVTLNSNPTTKLNPFIDLGVQWPEVKNGQTSAILDGGLAYIIGRNLQVDAEIGTSVHGDTGPRPFIGFGVSWRAKSKHR